MSDFEAHTDQADAISSRAARDGRCTANDLQLVIAALVDQITVSDRRQADLLEGMHARLSELGSAARETRTRVPAAYADAFHRVEDALAALRK